jgi:hypothetical protein
VHFQGNNLALQLYLWIGDALKPSFESLKPVQVSSIGLTDYPLVKRCLFLYQLKQLEDQIATLPKERQIATRLRIDDDMEKISGSLVENETENSTEGSLS